MKIRDIVTEGNPVTETTITTASSIAAVPNPTSAHSKPKKKGKYGAPQAPQKKNPDGTAKNALNLTNNLMGGKTIKR